MKGLSTTQANQLLEKNGKNVLANAEKISPLKIFFAQFVDITILVLIVAAIFSGFVAKDWIEAVIIAVIVVLNGILGFVQEYRAEKTMEALKNMAAPQANVYRDGSLVRIPASDLVVGDVVMLEAGDRVPADGKVLLAFNAKFDEAMLTGESLPVDKNIQENVFMGTTIVAGKCEFEIVHTGMQTEMGKIADMISNIETEQTPLQKKLGQLGKVIVFGCLAICAVVFVMELLMHPSQAEGWLAKIVEPLMAGVALAVAAIPEGLPAVVTIALALGVSKMIKKNALVRKLPAVETLGCVNVICTDKTGTLTENKMTVLKMFSDGKFYEVTGKSMDTKGEFIHNGKAVQVTADMPLFKALEIGSVCNNASISKKDGGLLKGTTLEVVGDPTEGALLISAAKGNLPDKSGYNIVAELPFDSDRKGMSTICQIGGQKIMFCKGAPDVLIERCTQVFIDGQVKPMTADIKAKIIAANADMAQQALRVIAMCYKTVEGNGQPEEDNLTFAGLTGMIDPPRPEVKTAVAKCIKAGIKPVMITGDHKDTATAIAKEIGIFKPGDLVLTGAELETMTQEDLEAVVEKVSVYARVSPRHKLMIVKAHKAVGGVACMTGDGVNDAPAIKEADIGVAMGITGTDVTKEAASMILTDDNYSTIINAVEQGRIIYANIRRFIRYMLSCNLGEVLTIFIAALIPGMPLPLLPIQILWVNLVTDGLPAIALGFEPAEDGIMDLKPRKKDENIFANGLAGKIFSRGILIAASSLLSFYILQLSHMGGLSMASLTDEMRGVAETYARTGAFMTLVLTQLIHALECKIERGGLFSIKLFNNKNLIWALICSFAMIAAAVYVPFLQTIFKTAPILGLDLLAVIGISVVPSLLLSVFKGGKKAE